MAPLWCRLYAMADTLALERQLQFKRDWKVLFGVGFIAFVCFAMFTHAGLPRPLRSLSRICWLS